jgi:hypothetical protein
MLSLIFGVVLMLGTAGAFWHLRARDGVPHPLAVARYLQVWIPIGITSGLVIGLGLVVSGLVSLNPL